MRSECIMKKWKKQWEKIMDWQLKEIVVREGSVRKRNPRHPGC